MNWDHRWRVIKRFPEFGVSIVVIPRGATMPSHIRGHYTDTETVGPRTITQYTAYAEQDFKGGVKPKPWNTGNTAVTTAPAIILLGHYPPWPAEATGYNEWGEIGI